MFVVVASHYLLKGRTRARFGSSRYCAQLFLFLLFLLPCCILLLRVLLLCSFCAPVLLRLVLMSSCVVVLLLLLRPAKCISDFSVRYVCLFIQEATHVYWVIGVHLPFFWVECGLQICAYVGGDKHPPTTPSVKGGVRGERSSLHIEIIGFGGSKIYLVAYNN